MAILTPDIEWVPAHGKDIDAMVQQCQHQLSDEVSSFCMVDPLVYAHNLTRAVVDQFYNPSSCLLWLARSGDLLLGYVWAERGQRMVWSADEMVAIKIMHVDMTLPARQRLTLVDQMITVVEAWTAGIHVPIVCSTTMRGDQEGFLRLHERRGYDRRGSICYKRLGTAAATPASSSHPD